MKKFIPVFIVFLIVGCTFLNPKSDGNLSYKPYLDSYPSYLYGIIDSQGKQVLPPTYKYIGEFSEGLAVFSNDWSNFGYINTNGDIVIPAKFVLANAFSEGIAAVVYTPSFSFDMNPIYQKCGMRMADSDCIIGMMKIQKNNSLKGHWGYIYKNGTFLFQPQFDGATKFVDGIAGVAKNGKWGFIDIYGKYILPSIYINAGYFSEGLAPVAFQDEKWGFIDKDGNTVIQPKYSNAKSFHQGLAAVEVDYSNWGYIKKDGEFLIKPIYLDARDFNNNNEAEVEYTCRSAYCRENEYATSYTIIYKKDYYRDDNLLVKIIKAFTNETSGEKAKATIFNISKNGLYSIIIGILIFIMHIAFWLFTFDYIGKKFPFIKDKVDRLWEKPVFLGIVLMIIWVFQDKLYSFILFKL